MNLDDYNISRLKQLIILYTKDDSILIRDENAHKKFLSGSDFTSDEHQIAISAIKENVLEQISKELIDNYNKNWEKTLDQTPDEGLDNINSYFKQAYDIFPLDQKKELLPLFFNYNLTQQKSIFFHSNDISDYYFNLYLTFISKDKLNFETIKKLYLDDENYIYTIFYPMYEKIMSLSTMLS